MAAKTVDITTTLQELSVPRERLAIPPDIRSVASGLSARMGCSVIIKSLSVANDRYRLTLEVSPGCGVKPQAKAMIDILRQGAVVLARESKTLAVVQGHASFSENCCSHVRSILSGLVRDHNLHEIELILVENTSQKGKEKSGSAKHLND